MGSAHCCNGQPDTDRRSECCFVQPTPYKDSILHMKSSLDIRKSIVNLLEAQWQGYSTRKQVAHLRKSLAPNHSYFSIAESKETLNSRPPTGNHSGRFTYKSGSVYIGDWFGGFRHGYGIQEFPGGQRYEGMWSFGFPNGKGKFSYTKADCFKGKFLKYYVRTKDRFEANRNLQLWKDQALEGYLWIWIAEELKKNASNKLSDQLKFSSGSTDTSDKLCSFKSTFKMIKADIKKLKKGIDSLLEHGFNSNSNRKTYRFSYPDGSVYTGEWHKHKRNGNGKFVGANGDVYEGEWCNDMQSGLGRLRYADGSCYIGFFYKNLKHGIGEFRSDNGDLYTGQWNIDKMHGVGKFYWDNGRKYIGSWKNSQRNGFGCMQYSSTSWYEGEFENGKPNGYGVLHNLERQDVSGKWRDGKLAESNQN